MPETPRNARKNRTNVRFLSIRLALRLLSRVAPAAVERWALRLWSTPRRVQPPRPPEVAGLPGRRFDVPAGRERLAAWSWGSGPTVLLVHGWNGHAAQMTAFVAPLVAAGHRVVAFDQPGHGQSSGTTLSALQMRDAVLALGHQVGPLAAVVAHSLGATATVLALAEGLNAQRAVLLAPPAESPPFARAFATAMGLSAARTEGLLERVRQALGGDFARLDLRRIAPRMRIPALVIHDAEDREVPFAHGKTTAEAWPGARLHTTEGLGHTRLLRTPALIDEVTDFITTREAVGASSNG